MLFLKRRKAENICVVQCGKSGVRYQSAVGGPVERTSIYARSFLSAEIADRNAMISISRAMGVSTLAEGVETEEQLLMKAVGGGSHILLGDFHNNAAPGKKVK